MSKETWLAQDAVAEACGFLSLLGCASFLSTFEQRLTLVKEAARAFVVGRTQGLETLGVAEAVRSYPGTLKALFVGVQIHITFVFFISEGSRPVTLGQILVFASGTDTIPPLGFPTRPKLVFLHWEGVPRIFPEANTCDVTLRLPLHSSYSAFVEHMDGTFSSQ
uniref:HECT domain-containing protein n=1 Tax=Oryzias latipes TaxID=8090 RepID=A0A3P9LHB6_ORYLA